MRSRSIEIDVEVNTDIFTTPELIEELESRTLKPDEKAKIKMLVAANVPELKSATELWKVEFFMDNIDKISLESLEAIVNGKMEMA